MPGIIETFQIFSGILVICPCCRELLRISDLNLRYTGKFERTIVDNLRQMEREQRNKQESFDRKEERFDAREDKLREEAAQRGRRSVKTLIRKIDPSMSRLQYNPQDIKVISHPVDLIVFDGLNNRERVKNIVFIARSKAGNIKSLRRSVEKAIVKGNYVWQTVRVGLDGSLQITEK